MRLNRPIGRQRGTSLVEVLVAVLVVTLGVIAMAGLMASATRLGKAGESRAVAAQLAADLADRMKANVCAVIGETESCPAGSAAYDQTGGFRRLGARPADPPVCAVALACTPAELARIDLARWNQALYDGLPNGLGYVQHDAGAAGAGGAVDVWVTWLDPSALSDGIYQAIDDQNPRHCPPGFQGVSPQPRCMYFRVGL
jgi:type IV pilus assembly protein PilV